MMSSTESECEPDSKDEDVTVNVWITHIGESSTKDKTHACSDEHSDLEEGEIHSPDRHGCTVHDNSHTGVQQRENSSTNIPSADCRQESHREDPNTVFYFESDQQGGEFAQISYDSAGNYRQITDDQSLSGKSDINQPRNHTPERGSTYDDHQTSKRLHDCSGKHDNLPESQASDHGSSKSDNRQTGTHYNESSSKPDNIQDNKHTQHSTNNDHNYQSSKRNGHESSKSDNRQTGDGSHNRSSNPDKRKARKDLHYSACESGDYKTSNGRDKRKRGDNSSPRTSLKHGSRASNNRSRKREHSQSCSSNSDRRIVVDSNRVNTRRDRVPSLMTSNRSLTTLESNTSVDKEDSTEERHSPLRPEQQEFFRKTSQGGNPRGTSWNSPTRHTSPKPHSAVCTKDKLYEAPDGSFATSDLRLLLTKQRQCDMHGESSQDAIGTKRKLPGSDCAKEVDRRPSGNKRMRHDDDESSVRMGLNDRSPDRDEYKNGRCNIDEMNYRRRKDDSSRSTDTYKYKHRRQKHDTPNSSTRIDSRSNSQNSDECRQRRHGGINRYRSLDHRSSSPERYVYERWRREHNEVNNSQRKDNRSRSPGCDEYKNRRWANGEMNHNRRMNDSRNRSPDRGKYDRRRWRNHDRGSACSSPDPVPEKYRKLDDRALTIGDRSPHSSRDLVFYSDGRESTYFRNTQRRESSYTYTHVHDLAKHETYVANQRETSVCEVKIDFDITTSTDDGAQPPPCQSSLYTGAHDSSDAETVEGHTISNNNDRWSAKPTSPSEEILHNQRTGLEIPDRFDTMPQITHPSQCVSSFVGNTSAPLFGTAKTANSQYFSTVFSDGMPRQTPRLSTIRAFKLLRDLETQEPRDIMIALGEQGSDLGGISVLSMDNKAIMKLFLSVFAKSVACKSMNEHMTHILYVLHQHSFFDAATSYFMNLPSNEAHQFWKELKDMLKIMAHLAMYSLIPVREISGIHAIMQMVVDRIEAVVGNIDDEVMMTFREFSIQKEKLLAKNIRLEDLSRDDIQNQLERFEDSQKDFRDINVFPSVMDMQIYPGNRLQPSKVKGQYESLDEYLEIQFRLLREDFVGPLREGISEYVQSLRDFGSHKKLQDVKIYNNVNVLCPVASESGICYLLKFDVSGLKRVRWASTKRFIYGSLLCLSEDKFQTICFATVMDRDPKQLEQGLLTVKIEQAVLDINKLCQTVFTMAETNAYFESYRHVLAGLQNFREGDLPFAKYIVFCESEVQAPEYLRKNQNTEFDLRPLVDADVVLHTDPKNIFTEESKPAEKVDILDVESWPPADLLHLDESQLRALHTALTKEFAIIQGPPGTGKTYLGLKIAKALLHNKSKWEVSEHAFGEVQRPMLIVCYTNHALDQFLEGIVKFFNRGVLRVGNRSNSGILKSLNLKEARQKLRQAKSLPFDIYISRIETRAHMWSLRKSICESAARLRYAKTTILHERCLRFFMRNHYDLLVRQVRRKFTTDSAILVWLGIVQLDTGQSNRNGQPFYSHHHHVDSHIEIQDEVEFIESQRRLNDLDEFNSAVGRDQYTSQIDKEKEIENIESSIKRFAVALDIETASMALRRRGRLTKRNTDAITWANEHLQSTDVMTPREARRINNMFRISKYDRWRLYRLWRKGFCEYYARELSNDTHLYNAAAAQNREIRMQEDREIMQSSTVIGMTTSAAARYQAILQEVQPKIIIVEEAAEVLEAHIITSLSKTCEHLILIGDHKQLKPNPNVYKLAKKFNLDVSLFERMVNNNLRCDCLELQHRMRPEIASLMNHIYDNYRNHEDCSKYEDVKGVSTNVFFVDHDTDESYDDDLRSHSNKHEAQFMVALCKYLLQQGYEATQITVLALYSGQLSVLKGLMPKSEFEGVRVTAVDNYQGEENDIILLTLVRSNNEGNIGFLKIDNRVCVALSRAKVGLYVIGNFDLLAKRGKTPLWRSLVADMKQRKQLGDGLTLQCQNHPNDAGIVVKSEKDFEKAPEGGCSIKCENRLECGHVCERYCHVLDKDHKEYKCMKECGKLICKGHETKCRNVCHKPCQECTVLTDKKLRKCGHQQKVPCNVSPKDFSCKWQCQQLLECSHPCKCLCSEAHTTKCLEKVEKTWPCKHTAEVECNRKDIAQCPFTCGAILDCRHPCTRECGLCVDGWLHLPCTQKCKRILVCDHECTGLCNQCPPCTRQCENRCVHSKCKKRCGDLCVPCKEKCPWKCEHYKCSKLCCEPCDRPRCNEPCKEILKCTHPCIGLCGEPCPKYCRICHAERVTEIMFGDEEDPKSRFVLLEDCIAKCIIESKAMDDYMDSVSTDRGKIKLCLKKCPKCSTIIRKSNRYRTVLNKILQDIEVVKAKIYTNKFKARIMENDIYVSLEEYMPDDLKTVVRQRLHGMQEPKSENAFIALKNQIEIMRRLGNMETKIKARIGDDIDSKKKTLLASVKKFKTWVMTERQVMTSYELEAAESELVRLEHHVKFQLHTTRLRATHREPSESLKLKIIETRDILNDNKKYDVAGRVIVEECLTELEKEAPLEGLGIYEEERVMILKAMELPAGHWFKCSQGHVYAIGDCGGAMVESQCPECNSMIGGGSHRLREDNQLATEMDQAQFPAWSEQANMINYEMVE